MYKKLILYHTKSFSIHLRLTGWQRHSSTDTANCLFQTPFLPVVFDNYRTQCEV